MRISLKGLRASQRGPSPNWKGLKASWEGGEVGRISSEGLGAIRESLGPSGRGSESRRRAWTERNDDAGMWRCHRPPYGATAQKHRLRINGPTNRATNQRTEGHYLIWRSERLVPTSFLLE